MLILHWLPDNQPDPNERLFKALNLELGKYGKQADDEIAVPINDFARCPNLMYAIQHKKIDTVFFDRIVK